MKNRIVDYHSLPGLTKLFKDYIYQPDKLTRYFDNLDFQTRRDRILKKSYDRTAISEILTRQNQDWGAPDTVIQNISKLNETKSLIVTGGQQACLFGGPYMIIVKAITVIKQARLLEEKLGVPVMPLFSIAADDHDFEEISGGQLFDRAGEPVSLNIDFDSDKLYRPVGDISYDGSLNRELTRLIESLPKNEFYQSTVEKLTSAYGSERKITDCFAEYLLSLLGQYGLVLFNPYDASFKKMAVPFMQAVVTRRDSIKKALAQASQSLAGDGYHQQVQKAESAVHLFFNHPYREAVHFTNNNFTCGDKQFTPDEICEAIAHAPLDFSPDVLLQPVMQAELMPVIAIVGGASEVAYYAQLLPVFDLFEIGRPKILPRSSVTLVEKKYEKMIDRYGLSFSKIAQDIEAVIRTVLSESFPDDLSDKFARLRKTIGDSISEIDDDARELAPQLSGMLEKTGGKIDYQLKEALEKIFAAHKKRSKGERDKFYQLRDHLWAGGSFSERSVIPAYFTARYGEKVIGFLYENIILNETGHQLLMLSEYDG